MRRVRAAVALVVLLVGMGLAPYAATRTDVGGMIGGRWGLIGAGIGAIGGGILGGLAGSFLAPGPATVIGEMSGSDLGMLVGGA
jgi:hypothetical protein